VKKNHNERTSNAAIERAIQAVADAEGEWEAFRFLARTHPDVDVTAELVEQSEELIQRYRLLADLLVNYFRTK